MHCGYSPAHSVDKPFEAHHALPVKSKPINSCGKGELEEFSVMMSKNFPVFDLDYSFKDKKFINEQTENMFLLWKLLKNN